MLINNKFYFKKIIHELNLIFENKKYYLFKKKMFVFKIQSVRPNNYKIYKNVF